MLSYEQIRASNIKRTRLEILQALLLMYEIGPLSYVEICAALLHLELADDTVIRKDLTYLEERGYVRWENKASYVPWDKRFYKLTAAGSDIVNKIATDPALEI
jgi:hypothetical protein